ncbi:hypothetical protein CR201_G0056298 [Pongo abelii]|uniref:Uncharacterized protein n=1 Tax=Pongo abelii TaxID=9601 RepID=A0A2J8Y7S5_PONAB|nr:hypothetical protein CR201_G0056298 [Pongo abelii]
MRREKIRNVGLCEAIVQFTRTRFIVRCRSSATACTRTLRGSRTAAGPRWAVPAHVPGHSAGEPAHHPGHQR